MGSINPAGTTNPKIDNGYFTYALVIGPIDYKRSFYNGMLMTTGILGSIFLLDKFGQTRYTPNLHVKDYFSLATVTILSQIAIDYGKARGYVPSGLK